MSYSLNGCNGWSQQRELLLAVPHRCMCPKLQATFSCCLKHISRELYQKWNSPHGMPGPQEAVLLAISQDRPQFWYFHLKRVTQLAIVQAGPKQNLLPKYNVNNLIEMLYTKSNIHKYMRFTLSKMPRTIKPTTQQTTTVRLRKTFKLTETESIL